MDRLSFDKVFYHKDSLDQWMETGDTSSPVHMQLSLTNGCNHRCPWCSIAQMQKHATPTMIDGDRLVEFLSEMTEHGLKAVTLVGNGEPLSHPDAAQIIRKLKAVGLEIGLFTNASYLYDDVAEAVLECNTFVRMTMNAFNPQTYSKTHGIPDEENAVEEFLKCTSNMADLSNARSNLLPTIGVQCATHQWNFRELVKQTRFVRDSIGADYFSIKPVINRSSFQGRVATESRPRNNISMDELEPILLECEELANDSFSVYAKREQFAVALPHDFNDGREYSSCIALPFEAYIHENGNFDICGPIKLGGTYGSQPNYSAGAATISENVLPSQGPFNIYHQSFEEIWKSPERQEMINSIDLSNCPAACRPHPLNKILWNVKKDGLPSWAHSLDKPEPDLHVNFL